MQRAGNPVNKSEVLITGGLSDGARGSRGGDHHRSDEKPFGYELLLFPCLAAASLEHSLEKHKGTGPCPKRPTAYQQALLVYGSRPLWLFST